MQTTPTKQLKADLSLIHSAIKTADGVPDSIKRLFGEIVAWNEAVVDHARGLDDRLEAAEAALNEIINDEGEMIAPETAVQLIASYEHAQLLCQAIAALLEGPLAGHIDEMSKKRFSQLIENTMRASAMGIQIVNELAGEDEEDEEAEEADDGDGLGDGDDGDAGDDADEEEGEAADE